MPTIHPTGVDDNSSLMLSSLPLTGFVVICDCWAGFITIGDMVVGHLTRSLPITGEATKLRCCAVVDRQPYLIDRPPDR